MADEALQQHLSEIEKAAERLKGVAAETPMIHSTYFSQESGNDIWIKPENLQNTGSFKLRGAYNRISQLTEEERAYYQVMVDTVNETFMETVASGRSLPIERVRELATGLTYTGIDAVQNGLADEIGTREDAIAKAAELAGMRTYAVVSLEPESDDLSDLVGLLSSSKMSNEDLIERLKELNGNGSQH